MPYRYEIHLHTSQSSACGRSTGAEHARYYKALGYDGIFVSDHFYRGNCAVRRDLPWYEWVRRFCEGYRDAKAEGDRIGLQVFFAWEESINGDDWLIYGLPPEWLADHPEIACATRREQLRLVHASGGCVVQAHPFRARSYNHTIYLAHALCDAVEIFNAGNDPRWDSLAARYAAVIGLPVTAGSDNHCADTMKPERLAGVAFDRPLDSVRDYVKAIQERRPFGLHLPVPVEEWTEDVSPDLPCQWLDENGRDTGADVMEILRRGR